MIIQPNDTIEIILREGPPSLVEVQRWVGGEVELITDIVWRGLPTQVYCNGEGKRKGLDENLIATGLLRAIVPGFAEADEIVAGPVVMLCGAARWT